MDSRQLPIPPRLPKPRPLLHQLRGCPRQLSPSFAWSRISWLGRPSQESEGGLIQVLASQVVVAIPDVLRNVRGLARLGELVLPLVGGHRGLGL